MFKWEIGQKLMFNKKGNLYLMMNYDLQYIKVKVVKMECLRNENLYSARRRLLCVSHRLRFNG